MEERNGVSTKVTISLLFKIDKWWTSRGKNKVCPDGTHWHTGKNATQRWKAQFNKGLKRSTRKIHEWSIRTREVLHLSVKISYNWKPTPSPPHLLTLKRQGSDTRLWTHWNSHIAPEMRSSFENCWSSVLFFQSKLGKLLPCDLILLDVQYNGNVCPQKISPTMFIVILFIIF